MPHRTRNALLTMTAILALYAGLEVTDARTANPLNANSADPRRLGWMTGFPPSPDKLIMHLQSDCFSFAKLCWTVCHIRELLPTKQVSRGIGSPQPLSYAIDKSIESVRFTPLGSAKPMTWKQSLEVNYTDGVLIIHAGRVVYEWSSGCLDETGFVEAILMEG